ncbi:MAG: phage baseplate plug protein [Lachnospiraceae bacterium]
MRDYIEINKDEIPYIFSIELSGEMFSLEVMYNEMCDFFTITLSKDGEVLVYQEPLVYNRPLFADMYQPGFPSVDLVPYDESGECNKVTWDNFGATVFLTIDDFEENEPEAERYDFALEEGEGNAPEED